MKEVKRSVLIHVYIFRCSEGVRAELSWPCVHQTDDNVHRAQDTLYGLLLLVEDVRIHIQK